MTVFGVVGATGAVGKEMIEVLYNKQPQATVRLFASKRSAGTTLETGFGALTVEEFTVEEAQKCDIVLLAVSGAFAKEHAKAIAKKAIVIDNSSAFRYDDDVPLVVPEINPQKDSRLIANPNCTTAIAAMALWPLHKEFGLKKVIVSSYQASSGAGYEGMEELRTGTAQFLADEEVKHSVFAHPLPFNVIPHIDALQSNGYTKEEMKVTWETQKIFGCPKLPISCTAVRIPTLRAHAESITIETEKEITPQRAREVLASAPGVVVVDDVEKLMYPTCQTASGKYDVEVGRIRQNLIFGSKGLDLFVCGDQLLRGAALNAVLIAETLL